MPLGSRVVLGYRLSSLAAVSVWDMHWWLMYVCMYMYIYIYKFRVEVQFGSDPRAFSTGSHMIDCMSRKRASSPFSRHCSGITRIVGGGANDSRSPANTAFLAAWQRRVKAFEI